MASVENRERQFFTFLTAVFGIVVLIGFARTFFLRSLFPEAQAFAAPESIFYVHGAFFAAWIGLLFIQALLIRGRRLDLHRRMGYVGIALAIIVSLLGAYGSLIAAQRPGGFIGVPVPPLQFLIFPIVDIVLFAMFFTLAVMRRNKAQTHKRLMILAAVNLIEAAIIRIPIGFIGAGAPFSSRGLSYLFIVALIVWDLRSSGRLDRATLWGGLLIIVSFPVRLVISQTQAWTEIASRLVQLVG